MGSTPPVPSDAKKFSEDVKLGENLKLRFHSCVQNYYVSLTTKKEIDIGVSIMMPDFNLTYP